MTTKPFAPIAAAAILILTLTGCGTTAPAADAPTTSNVPGDAPVTFEVPGGDELTLPDVPAKRVVALEWGQAEVLTSLGVELAGVSDVDGYRSWVGEAAPLIGDPQDVGARSEPSVEAIAALDPDLIVGVPDSVPDSVRDGLEALAPVALFEMADAADVRGGIERGVDALATAVDRADEGTALLDDLDATLASDATKIADAGLAETPAVFTSPYAEGSNVTIRMHGPRSAPQYVLDSLGLAAAWTEPGDDAYGLSYTDIEGLTNLPENTWFLYWANDSSDDPVDAYLGSNAVWQSLPFVKEGRVAPAADAIWVYGGPRSLAAFSDDVTEKLTAEQ